MPLPAESKLAVFRRAAELLASSTSFEETMANTIAAFLPVLGDFGFFDLDLGDHVQRTARAYEDPRVDAILRPTQWIRQERTDMNLCALSTGRPALHPVIDDVWYRAVAVNDHHLAVLRDLAFGSMISVPMRYQGELLGALTLFFGRSGRHFDDEHLELAGDLAALAAPVVANGRLLQRLRDASRAKDDFLAMLSHELRNPLAPILGALDVMDAKDRAPFRRERDMIARQVDHMVRLVDDLLDIARIARGKIQLAREHVDLVALVEAAVEANRSQFGGTIRVEAATRPLMVDGDPVRLTQVAGNLIANAAKFSRPAQPIDVRLASTPEGVELVVEDRGSGIDPKLLPHVFELFVQGPQELARERGGLGLGLAIVANLVALHGGTVGVTSPGIGAGSVFRVVLPHAANGAVKPAAVPLPARSTSTLRVLVVDDNVDAAETLGELLSVVGHEVRVVTSPSAALAVLADFAPQLAILDIGLPEMDGYELARVVRERAPGTRLFAVTGYGLPADRTRALEAGFAEHLVKPVDSTKLLDLVAQLAQRC